MGPRRSPGSRPGCTSSTRSTPPRRDDRTEPAAADRGVEHRHDGRRVRHQPVPRRQARHPEDRDRHRRTRRHLHVRHHGQRHHGPATLTATVTAGTTWTSDWLPLGTYTVTERNAPTGATITPTPAVIDDDGETITITATNPYRDLHGKLAIHKIETGTAAPGGTYTFDITGSDITGPATLTATVTAGTTWTSDWLPLGTYTVTERNAPTGATITPTPAVIDDDGETVTITATNPYRDLHGKLAIHKIETGTAAPGGTYTFDITGPGARP